MRMHSQDKVGGALHPDISRSTASGRRATAGGFGVNPFTRHPQRGSLILVVLCLLAVLGIALASFLAIGNQSMKLSNRSYRTSMSAQLAEMGLEEALRAFNQNDWSNWSSNPTNVSSGAWTLDTTNRRATRTIQFLNGKLGQGVTGTIKIRVDNYNSAQLDATWSSGLNYRVNDLIGDSGIWYRCIKSHVSSASNRPANWNYWVQEGIPWTWDSTTTYEEEDIIVYNEIWYRCLLTNTNKPPPTNATEWKALVAIYTSVPAWPYVAAGQEALLFSGGSIVQLTNSTWTTNPPYSWRWRDAQPYKYNDVAYYNGAWYRSNSNHTSSWSNYPTGWATAWTPVTNMWTWDNSRNYDLNDVVYHSASSSWYRCIKENSGQTPSGSAAYWSNAPRLSPEWNSGRQYSQNDTVFYNGVWYLSLQDSNSGQNPSTATSYWIGADTTDATNIWNSSTSYSVGDYRCYGGVWYKCLSGGSNKSPNNSSYWTASWWQSSSLTTGAPVIYVEGVTTLPDGTAAITTQFRATLTPAPLFPNALGATTLINLPTSATVDSYDSTLGTYNQTTSPFTVGSPNRGSSAVVAGGLTTSTAVTVNSARINGYVAAPSSSTTPYAPRWSYGGTAIVTSEAAPTTPSPRVDLTRVSRSPYIPQFDVQSVAGGTALTMSSGTVTIGTPGATTPSVYTISGNLDRTSSSPVDILNIIGPVIINVTGRLYVTSPGKIIISATGSAEIHFSSQLWVGSMDTISGIQNLTLDPKKCILIGTSTANSSGSHYYWAQSPFYGAIYMPNAYLSTWSNVPIYGAISAKNIAFPQSGCQLHYDTSLRYATIPGVDQSWSVSEWRELTDPNERAVLP